MEHTNHYSMVVTTCADRESAKKLAYILVQERLAACVQILPIESVYVWKGEVCNENETMLFVKTKTDHFDKLSAKIKENHSYETPEIIMFPITDGLPEYLLWIGECINED